MCKDILVASSAIEQYPTVYNTATYMDTSCNMGVVNNTFINWYKYTYGGNK